MRSVARIHRATDARRLGALSPAERVELALRLGDEDVEIFRSARGLDREDALRLLRQTRQAGRRRCSFLDESA